MQKYTIIAIFAEKDAIICLHSMVCLHLGIFTFFTIVHYQSVMFSEFVIIAVHIHARTQRSARLTLSGAGAILTTLKYEKVIATIKFNIYIYIE